MNPTDEFLQAGIARHRQSWFGGLFSLLASSSTLMCCAIPALLVTLGAGATLSSLVATFPQIVWLSEHKPLVFGFATTAMVLAGWLQWQGRYAPCPADPALRDICLRTRKTALRVYIASVLCLAVGVFFAFIAPRLAG
ncbi:MAG TPA: hypothetical protein VLB90_07995 [Pseudomonadales bacterium]|nr:hypothetical protein [Pseudomonadales bacterium]